MRPVGRRVFPALLVHPRGVADSRGSSRHRVRPAARRGAVRGRRGAERVRRASSTSASEPVAALQALGWALVVVLLSLSCAVRSTAVHGVPPIAVLGGLRVPRRSSRSSSPCRSSRAAPVPAQPSSRQLAVSAKSQRSLRDTCRLERQRVRGRFGDVDQRLHEEERADRDDDARADRGRERHGRAGVSRPPGRAAARCCRAGTSRARRPR